MKKKVVQNPKQNIKRYFVGTNRSGTADFSTLLKARIYALEFSRKNKDIVWVIESITKGRNVTQKIKGYYQNGKELKHNSQSPKENPKERFKYFLVGEWRGELRLKKRGNDYDKLQELADKHNDNAGEKELFVITAKDWEIQQAMRGNSSKEIKPVRNIRHEKFKYNIEAKNIKGGEWFVVDFARTIKEANEMINEFMYGTTEKKNRKYRISKIIKNTAKPFNTEKLTELSEMFQGHVTGNTIKTVGSDYTPELTARCGKLASILIKNGKDVYQVKFGKDAWLSMDIRKNVYIEGRDGRITNLAKLPNKGSMQYLGELQQVNYQTEKSHIENGRMTEYYHQFGEIDGIKPNLFIDSDGYPIILGGNYDIEEHGIGN